METGKCDSKKSLETSESLKTSVSFCIYWSKSIELTLRMSVTGDRKLLICLYMHIYIYIYI